MGFLKKLLGLESNLIKLISVTIVTDEDHSYFVAFCKHHPQLQLPEFVRLVLHYYAKILFNFDPSDQEMAQSASILRKMMDKVLAIGIKKDTNVLGVADISDVVKIVSLKPHNVPRQIAATLFFVNTTQRNITTDIPQNVYAQQIVFSVMVLLQSILTEIDENCISVLNRSLKNMHSAYDGGQSFSEIQNLAAVPTTAYLSAIMGE
jgi:hypothetical protein